MAFQGRLPGNTPDLGANTPSGGDPAAIEAAHRAILADRSIQFDLAQPPTPAPPPEWLITLLGWLAQMGPVWRVIFWVLIAVAVIAIVIALVPPLREWAIDLWHRRRPVIDTPTPEWVPEQTQVRALLDDADRLAASGDFDGAVHLLLLRSIGDIEAWRGNRLAPSLTSRDIAASDLPGGARGVFGRIATTVERSLFAGNRLSVDDWQHARADYAAFALGRG